MLNDIYNGLKSLDVEAVAIDILLDMSEFIADLNRAQLSEKGVNDEGVRLSPEYADITKDLKSRKTGIASIIEHVTLFDKGDLHESITADIYGQDLVLDATDWKLDDLESKYGNFLGLTNESIEKVKEEFQKRFSKELNRLLLSIY